MAKNEDPNFVSNPSLFMEMAVPFADAESANEAMKAFHLELAELRKKHKITCFLGCIYSQFIDAEKEDSCSFMLPLFFGDLYLQEGMAAYLFGHAQKERQEMIGRMLDQSATIKKLPLKK